MIAQQWRLGEVDLVDRFSASIPALGVQVIFGLVCVLAGILARGGVFLLAGAAGPYSLIYPAILISALFGRWQAGLITFVGSFAYAWYAVLPYTNSFQFEQASDGPRTVVNGAAALIILVFAELFRRAVRRAAQERDGELRTHELLLRELDHRTKNNFAMVASMLEMQRRHHESDDVREALAIASARVHSFAAIHDSIYSGAGYVENINMRDYLSTLSNMLSGALFHDNNASISLECDDTHMPRDTAVAIGLVMNEIVTNAAKHAFADQQDGEIKVTFQVADDTSWQLTVADNGRGEAAALAPPSSSGGLGSRLMEAFAKKAGGELATEWPGVGTRVTLTQANIAPDEV